MQLPQSLGQDGFRAAHPGSILPRGPLLRAAFWLVACLGLGWILPAWASAADNRSLASVPLAIADDIPYLQVRVNGSDPVWFGLDSGASGCVLDPALCRKLGIPMEGQARGTGAGAGTYEMHFAKNITYGVGACQLPVEKSLVIDLSGVSSPPDKKMQGLLGYEFFLPYVLAIDYAKESLQIWDARQFTYRGSGVSLPLVFKRKVPWVKVKLDVAGHAPAEREWLIDTGSGDTFNDELLSTTTAARKEITGGHGLGKEFQVIQASANRIDLGRYHFRNVPGVSGGMKIGGGLLKHFTAIFDYSRKRMILEPNQRYQE